jgi:hypothetical protein
VDRVVPKISDLVIDGFPFDIDKLLTDTYDNIDIAGEILPAVLEWINEQRQSVLYQKILAEQAVKEMESTVLLELKTGGFIERYPGIKPTDAMVKAAVPLDPRVHTAYDRFANLVSWYSRLCNVEQSINVKHELVRSAEATRRKLYQDEPTLPPRQRDIT